MEGSDKFCKNEVEPRSSYDVKEESELSDDEKMEKFYELIRRFSRDLEYQRSLLQSHDEKIKGRGDRDRDQPIWVPSFKWEDFSNVDDVKICRINDDHDHEHHVAVDTPDHNPPPRHVYMKNEHCPEKKKRRKTMDCSDEEREKRKIESESKVSDLDLNLAL